MPAAPRPITGRCLCGAVTYSADAEPAIQAVCHCTDCQRQTGGPFSVIVAVPAAAFAVEGDTIGTYTTTGEDHGGETQRNFCTTCGAPVFSVSPVMPDVVFIKSGSLDDQSWLEPSVEAWTTSAQPWAPRLAGIAGIERGPG
jgi:hypothetical protein